MQIAVVKVEAIVKWEAKGMMSRSSLFIGELELSYVNCSSFVTKQREVNDNGENYRQTIRQCIASYGHGEPAQ